MIGVLETEHNTPSHCIVQSIPMGVLVASVTPCCTLYSHRDTYRLLQYSPSPYHAYYLSPLPQHHTRFCPHLTCRGNGLSTCPHKTSGDAGSRQQCRCTGKELWPTPLNSFYLSALTWGKREDSADVASLLATAGRTTVNGLRAGESLTHLQFHHCGKIQRLLPHTASQRYVLVHMITLLFHINTPWHGLCESRCHTDILSSIIPVPFH